MAQQTINNGEVLSSIRGKLNTMFNEIYTSISSLGTTINNVLVDYGIIQDTISDLSVSVNNQLNVNITTATKFNTIEADILSLETTIAPLADIGLTAVTYTGTPLSLSLVTTPVKISWFDIVSMNLNNKTNPDNTVDKIIILEGGYYKISGTIILEAPQGNHVSIQMFKNGNAITPVFNHQGLGSGKPFGISYVGSFILSTNDELELYASADASITATLQTTNVIFEKLPY